jgi:hypothetical protein
MENESPLSTELNLQCSSVARKLMLHGGAELIEWEDTAKREKRSHQRLEIKMTTLKEGQPYDF